MITPLDFVPHAAQGVVEIATPLDTAVVVVTVDGVETQFEFDNNGIVYVGRILVPIGGSPGACAINLAAAINKHWGDRIRAIAENNIVDVVAHTPEVSLGLGTLGGGVTAVLTMNPQRVLPTGAVLVQRDVYPADVARGKIVVHVRLDHIELVQVKFLGQNAWDYTFNWTGYVVTSPGKIELVNAGSILYALTNWFQLIAIGDRYEQ